MTTSTEPTINFAGEEISSPMWDYLVGELSPDKREKFQN